MRNYDRVVGNFAEEGFIETCEHLLEIFVIIILLFFIRGDYLTARSERIIRNF